MNKKEISEIRKQLNIKNCPITYITGCYVNEQKEKVLLPKKEFLMLTEEEQFKYIDLFRKTLSGKLEKNLFNYEFNDEMNNNQHKALMNVRNVGFTNLNADEVLNEFYEKVIENYYTTNHFAIIIGYGAYDIPMKATDGTVLEDGSVEIYNHMICCICPVNLTKSGLSYQTSPYNDFHERIRERVIDMPLYGFLFPAFTDRCTDIHSLLYYSKKPDELNDDFIKNVLGCTPFLNPVEQKELFLSAIRDGLGSECTFDNVKAIHEKLNEMSDEMEYNPEINNLAKKDILRIISSSDISMQAEDSLEEVIEDNAEVKASNIINNKFVIKTEDAVISINSNRAHIATTKNIDGIPCLVIEINGECSVNGIKVNNKK